MDRTEWFTEKATEIGFDELSFLNCRYSERKVIKKERIGKNSGIGSETIVKGDYAGTE